MPVKRQMIPSHDEYQPLPPLAWPLPHPGTNQATFNSTSSQPESNAPSSASWTLLLHHEKPMMTTCIGQHQPHLHWDFRPSKCQPKGPGLWHNWSRATLATLTLMQSNRKSATANMNIFGVFQWWPSSPQTATQCIGYCPELTQHSGYHSNQCTPISTWQPALSPDCHTACWTLPPPAAFAPSSLLPSPDATCNNVGEIFWNEPYKSRMKNGRVERNCHSVWKGEIHAKWSQATTKGDQGQDLRRVCYHCNPCGKPDCYSKK